VPGSDAAIDEAIRLWPDLDAFVTLRSDEVVGSFRRLREALGEVEAAAAAGRPPAG
jgi:flagellum-specific ATP synthase